MQLKAVTMYVSFDLETGALSISIDGLIQDNEWQKRVQGDIGLTQAEAAQLAAALDLIPAAIRRKEGAE